MGYSQRRHRKAGSLGEQRWQTRPWAQYLRSLISSHSAPSGRSRTATHVHIRATIVTCEGCITTQKHIFAHLLAFYRVLFSLQKLDFSGVTRGDRPG